MEKVLEEAELCGALCLAGRKMKEFPSVLSTKYDLSDLVSLVLRLCIVQRSEDSHDGFVLIYHHFEDNKECEREVLSDATENLKLSIEAHEWFGYLSGNRLSDVPACVCESRSLESLRLRDNILRSIPLNIFYLRSLTVLDLRWLFIRKKNSDIVSSNNKIVHLPLSLFELPLEIVLLNGNRLDSIPHEIRQLSSTLAELDLSCNLLRSIPVDIALLKMLRVLNLRRNLLEQFPSELCRLSLHTLDLSCNRLKHLPPHIGKMGSLVEFHMRHNPLQFPPADLIVKVGLIISSNKK
ncbi:leucine Rich repeat-containing domain protein [Necator americanus]|uniref:Leucine Rich repeat-containing domain protein n=1 Tax=Necator americanus TaxID=51031 RepID=W2SYG8_NECAM|nr:leucine Rich repeat-containing domain protein [Necator americanus]ETN73941.1 leucine Rich repeat-containing domain protein [Necator americanus]